MKWLLPLFLLISVSSGFAQDKTTATKAEVTFVELGSVTCIPCKQMKPVMENIEKKYSPRVKVVFYDINKEENKKTVSQFKIKLIPTQVFLDANGKEFFRHEGFYPQKQIEKLIAGRGIKPVK